jgi:GTPase SAR1 family protein
MHNILVVGDSGVGKTSWINRLVIGEFDDKKRNRNKYAVYTDKFGLTNLEFFDGYRNAPNHIDVVIIMFDLSEFGSCHSVQRWKSFIEKTQLGKIPVIVCANKADIQKRTDYSAMPVSAKSWYNYEKVLKEILFQIKNVRVDKLLQAPPTVPVTIARRGMMLSRL